MNNLLNLALEAHGGYQRWREFTRFRARLSIGGGIWTLKRQPGLLNDVNIEGAIRDQRLTISPFPEDRRRSTWEPLRQTIETEQGIVTEERVAPAHSFDGHVRQTPWDQLQAAYFASEANWNYFVSPFLFARDDFIVEELAPWVEHGQRWRTLLVTYPEGFVAHSPQQTYYFDDSGLLRRIDYSVGIIGGGSAIHYPSEYRRFDGILVPTRRTVYVRGQDGMPESQSVSVSIEVATASFD
jgi:hypothetical protein